jgi:thiamine-phosphate pyrophosphorylase
MSLAATRPLLAAVTNRHLFAHDDASALLHLAAWAGRVARAGIDIIQIRERGVDDAALVRLVRHVVSATQGSACRVLVNDRLDVALAAGAAGVHLPGAGIPVRRAREMAPEGFLIGRSVHGVEEARTIANEGGADYLTFGTVFESASKPPGHRVSGVVELQRACAATALPILAIGGMTFDRVPAIARAGAAGIAAVRLFATPPTGAGDRGLTHAVEAVRSAWDRRATPSGWVEAGS